MATNGPQERPGRETRLLIMVVVVSIAVLLLLARFRFPAAERAVAAPPPSPLAGLAGRAAFDDLARTMSTLVNRVSSRVVLIELGMIAHEEAPVANGTRGRGPRGAAASRGPSAGGAVAPPSPTLQPRYALGLRMRSDLAVVHVPVGWHPVAVVGSTIPMNVEKADAKREIALIHLEPLADFRADTGADPFGGFAYVGALEAARGGPSIQPLFIGRADLVADERWPAGVYALGATAVTPGTFVFAIDGKTIGLVVGRGPDAVLVPAFVLDAVVTELVASGDPPE